MNVEGNSFGDRRRNRVACYTQIRSHLVAGNFRQLQNFASEQCNWNERMVRIRWKSSRRSWREQFFSYFEYHFFMYLTYHEFSCPSSPWAQFRCHPPCAMSRPAPGILWPCDRETKRVEKNSFVLQDINKIEQIANSLLMLWKKLLHRSRHNLCRNNIKKSCTKK